MPVVWWHASHLVLPLPHPAVPVPKAPTLSVIATNPMTVAPTNTRIVRSTTYRVRIVPP